MMDSRTIGKRSLQPEEQENGSLYLHLFSARQFGNSSVWYKIDHNEAIFSKEEVLISDKGHQLAGYGSAMCGTTLYLFGGWGTERRSRRGGQQVYSLDLASSKKKFDILDHEMQTERAFPKTVTVGENIYIFGSDIRGYGEVEASETEDKPWAEVLNTTHKTFERLNPPPRRLFEMECLGVSALIEKEGGDEILIAPNDFSHLFFYNVKTSLWHSKTTNITSPFPLYSMRSPVTDKYIFLYGEGKICSFDIDKNQFLKINFSLSDYVLFHHHEVPGVIHHLGGCKFCLVVGETTSHLVTHIHVISFDIANAVSDAQLGHFEASKIKVADYVLSGEAFVDSLSSNQILSLGNLNNGKRPRKSDLIEKGLSSGTSHLDDNGMMDYGATSILGNDQDFFEDTNMSKLKRKRVFLEKELVLVIDSARKIFIPKIAELRKSISASLSDDKIIAKIRDAEVWINSLTISSDDINCKSYEKGMIILEEHKRTREHFIKICSELRMTAAECPRYDFFCMLDKLAVEDSNEEAIAKLGEISALEGKIMQLIDEFEMMVNLLDCTSYMQ